VTPGWIRDADRGGEEAKRLRAIAGCICRLDRGGKEKLTKAYCEYVEECDDAGNEGIARKTARYHSKSA
jgi:hypothetical protein